MARTSHAPDGSREAELLPAPSGNIHTPSEPVFLEPGSRVEPAGSRPSLRTVRANQSLSEVFWGVRWSEVLPVPLSKQVTLHVGQWARVRGFMQDHAPQLVERDANQVAARTEAAKARFFEHHSDLFEFRVAGETVGLFVGEPADWSSYYCRAMTMDSRVGPRSVIRRFVREVLVKHLGNAGVERLVGDTSPTNRIMIRLFIDLGFQPSGQHLTDRWGTLARFTLFLDEHAEQSFARRYSANG